MLLHISHKFKTPLRMTTDLSNDNLEAERQRLYTMAGQCSLTSKPVLKQSHLVDKYIIEDLKRQLALIEKK